MPTSRTPHPAPRTPLPWTPGDPPLPADCRGGAVSVGNFDGVHAGHAALVAQLRAAADAAGGPAVAVTFDPHPLALLAPERLQPLLTTPADRSDLLTRAGADRVVILRTTPAMLALGATAFLDALFADALAAKAVVEGFNFGFGRGREGTIERLGQWCGDRGVSLEVVPPFPADGPPVSSSRVRAALLAGHIDRTTMLLSRPYLLRGVVGHGLQRGRTLGFPTANLEQPATLVPDDGVYAVRATVPAGTFAGAANVGPNPTFGEQEHKLEVHLLDFAGDLYGQPLAVEFLAKLRDIRPFTRVDALVEQLHADVAAARRVCDG